MNNHLTFEELGPLLKAHHGEHMSLEEFIENFPMVTYYKIGETASGYHGKISDFLGKSSFLISARTVYQGGVVGEPVLNADETDYQMTIQLLKIVHFAEDEE